LAKRRHGGLGRGLDALIPQKPWKEPEKEEKKTDGIEEAKGSGPEKDSGAERAAASESRDEGSVLSEAPSETASPEAGSVQKSAGGSGESGESGEAASAAVSADSSGSQSESKESSASADDSIRTLRLSQIDPNRSQPRQYFEDESLDELSESIRQFGVLQPILVQKKGNRYEIIAGERRWRAARKAGLTEIPAIVREYTDQETLELSLIENIQREDLNPIEEAKAFRRLVEEFSLRQEDLAVRVSKSRTAITNSLRLLKLDERVQDMIVQGQISMGHARALIPVEIPEEQYLIAQQIAEKHLSVRDVEKLIKARLSGKKKKKDSGKDKTAERDPALELAYKEIEERLKQSLGTKTTIRHSGDGTGKLEIEFYSHEDLEKIVDMLT
jgi:ParB family chromosome partitioning protein